MHVKGKSFLISFVISVFILGLSFASAQTPQYESIKKYLKPAVKNGGFSMDGYILWCSSVIKVDSTYHMFASRWPAQYGLGGWTTYSECVRATSKNLLGPYTFQEVVLQKRSGYWDNTRIHNVRIVKAGSKYVLFYIDTANETGYAEADSITGPWTRSSSKVIGFSNPAPLVRSDGSMYVFGRYAETNGLRKGVACTATSYKGPYAMVANSANLLPNDYELEDPTIWWANNQYNILVTDWNSKATGIYKGGAQYYSKDGISYKLVSTQAVFDRSLPVVYDDGSSEKFVKRERPFIYANEKGEALALFTACLYNETTGPSKVVVQPIDNYYPKDLSTDVGMNDNPLPQKFELQQNYPNPFNPSTTIQYVIPVGTLHAASTHVQIIIYDMLGKEISTLVDKEHKAGIYKINFNTQQTTDSKQLSTGVYLARLTTGDFSKTIKLLLIK